MPLKVAKRKGKSRYYYIRGTIRGITVEESTGTEDRELAEVLRIKRENEILQSSIYGRRSTATFLEAAVDYLEANPGVRFVDRLIDYFGATPLAQIDQHAIDLCAATLYPGRKPATLNRQVLGPLSAILKRASRRGLCDYFTIERFPEETVTRWITIEEAERLIASAVPHLQPLLIFLFGTGARVGETLSLDWRNVDLSRGHVSFVGETTKSGSSRGVPLNSAVVTALANLPHREGKVFRTDDGHPYRQVKNEGGQISTAFATACRRAQIADFTPHCCRHSWATWFYEQNHDLLALKELGGWKSIRMVMRYTHINTDHLKPQVESIDLGNFRGLIERKTG